MRDIQSYNPDVVFLLENVVMSKKWEKVISDEIGVEPIKINSALLSAQTRNRLYWTNIKGVEQPKDLGINLADIIESLGDGLVNKGTVVGRRLDDRGKRQNSASGVPCKQYLEVRWPNRNKSFCLTTVAKDNVLTDLPIGTHHDPFLRKEHWRYYTQKEMCRLQTLPDNYCDAVSKNQALKMLGNGWTIDVIAHILRYAKF